MYCAAAHSTAAARATSAPATNRGPVPGRVALQWAQSRRSDAASLEFTVRGRSLDALYDRADALAETNAHRRKPDLCAALFHRTEQRRRDARTRTTERMAKRDGAAIQVHPGLVIV